MQNLLFEFFFSMGLQFACTNKKVGKEREKKIPAFCTGQGLNTPIGLSPIVTRYPPMTCCSVLHGPLAAHSHRH